MLDHTTPAGRPLLEIVQNPEAVATEGARMLWMGDTMTTLAGYVDAVADERAAGVGFSIDAIRGKAAAVAVDLRAGSVVYQETGRALGAYAVELEVAAQRLSEVFVTVGELDALRVDVERELAKVGESQGVIDAYSPEAEVGVWLPSTVSTPFTRESLGPEVPYRLMPASAAQQELAETATLLASYQLWVAAQTHLQLVAYDVHYDEWEVHYQACSTAIGDAVAGAVDGGAASAYQTLEELQTILSNAGVAADVLTLVPFLAPLTAPTGGVLGGLELVTVLVQLGFSSLNVVDGADGQTSDDLLDVVAAIVGIIPFLGSATKLPDGKVEVAGLDQLLGLDELVDAGTDPWKESLEDAPYTPPDFVVVDPEPSLYEVP